MKKIFITRKFPQSILKCLSDSGYSIDMWNHDEPVEYDYMLQHSKDADGILCTLSDKINDNLLNSSKLLKVISTMSVGYDHIDLKIAKIRDIRVGYTPGVLTDATAELAVALLLMVSRRLLEGVESVKSDKWGAWKPFWMCGNGLKGSTVGIVGFGNIGKEIGKRLVPFGVKNILVTGSGQTKSNDQLRLSDAFIAKQVQLTQLLNECDFVVVSCAMTDKTKELFNTQTFNLMKKGSIFINISRGGVVNQDSLYNALINGPISAAGIDVCTPEPLPTNHKLLTLPNCVVLPHIGSATHETRHIMAQLAVDNLINGLNGDKMVAEIKL